jgi:chorismate mutase/prephenate dehydratase
MIQVFKLINYLPYKDVFDSVEKGHTTYGIVPFENSTYGSVVTTLDRFISCKTHILAETYLRVFALDICY